MELVKKYPINILKQKMLGKKVHFTSDCQLFPNFNVTGKVISMTMKNGETIINVIENKTNKHLSIGSNMKNLRFTVKKWKV